MTLACLIALIIADGGMLIILTIFLCDMDDLALARHNAVHEKLKKIEDEIATLKETK